MGLRIFFFSFKFESYFSTSIILLLCLGMEAVLKILRFEPVSQVRGLFRDDVDGHSAQDVNFCAIWRNAAWRCKHKGQRHSSADKSIQLVSNRTLVERVNRGLCQKSEYCAEPVTCMKSNKVQFLQSQKWFFFLNQTIFIKNLLNLWINIHHA